MRFHKYQDIAANRRIVPNKLPCFISSQQQTRALYVGNTTLRPVRLNENFASYFPSRKANTLRICMFLGAESTTIVSEIRPGAVGGRPTPPGALLFGNRSTRPCAEGITSSLKNALHRTALHCTAGALSALIREPLCHLDLRARNGKNLVGWTELTETCLPPWCSMQTSKLV
jgi:hypothetical protein